MVKQQFSSYSWGTETIQNHPNIHSMLLKRTVSFVCSSGLRPWSNRVLIIHITKVSGIRQLSLHFPGGFSHFLPQPAFVPVVNLMEMVWIHPGSCSLDAVADDSREDLKRLVVCNDETAQWHARCHGGSLFVSVLPC